MHYNGCMKTKSLIVFLLLAVSVACVAEDAKLVFNWAFVKKAADGAIPLDFKEKVAIAAGDLFKIHIQPVQNAYVYLFLQEANGELDLLFPDGFAAFDNKAYAQTAFYIPEGEDWFTLDNAKGTERFTLLASTERLKQLETLVLAFQKTMANTGSTTAAKNAAKTAVLDEIARLRKENSQLAVAAEKPVTIAGGTRGINEKVRNLATRIEATKFYYKLFKLEH
jgi:hypothetical protein